MNQGKCAACSSAMEGFGHARLLGRLEVDYFRCPRCGLVCTQEPDWLEEAYAEPLLDGDVGQVSRARTLLRPVTLLLRLGFNAGGRFLDYGAGHGLFVRLARDTGYDFRWHDPLARNVFARGFEQAAGERYELVTAFEVFEHLAAPEVVLAELAGRTDSVLLSTELLPKPCPLPADWWYYAPDAGQHVTFYTAAALAALGARHGMRLYTNHRNLHLLTRRKLPRGLFRFATQPTVARVLQPLLGRRRSLLPDDFFARSGKSLR